MFNISVHLNQIQMLKSLYIKQISISNDEKWTLDDTTLLLDSEMEFCPWQVTQSSPNWDKGLIVVTEALTSTMESLFQFAFLTSAPDPIVLVVPLATALGDGWIVGFRLGTAEPLRNSREEEKSWGGKAWQVMYCAYHMAVLPCEISFPAPSLACEKGN